MEKVLIVLGRYIHQTYPNGICVNKIIENWDYKIATDIVSAESEGECLHGQNIHPIYFTAPSNKISKLYYKIKKLFFAPLAELKLIKKMQAEIEKLCYENTYAAVIAVTNPPEAVEAVYRARKKTKNGQFIIYEIDPASNRYKTPTGIIEKYWSCKTRHWEKKMYLEADTVIHMKTHLKHFSSAYFSDFINKTIYLDIPNLNINTYVSKNDYKHKEKVLLYSGAFYPIMREPDYMLNTLSRLTQETVKLVIYTGRMQDKIRHICNEKNMNFGLNSLVSQEEIEKKIAESDILLSIGNRDSDFLPSKVLSYIAAGKPIIHYYFDENDVSLPYLKKYGNALLINTEETVDSSSEKIKNFINVSENFSVDIEKIKSDFIENTPEYNADKILKVIGVQDE